MHVFYTNVCLVCEYRCLSLYMHVKVRGGRQVPSTITFYLFWTDLSAVLLFMEDGQLASGICLSPIPSDGIIGALSHTWLSCRGLGYTPRSSYLYSKQFTQLILMPFPIKIKQKQTKNSNWISYLKTDKKMKSQS